jgi:hypothetical protein
MIKFNKDNKEQLSVDECLDPAMKITNIDNAIQYKKDYIIFIQKNLDKDLNTDKLLANEIANSNLGYYSKYFDEKTQKKVKKLFLYNKKK